MTDTDPADRHPLPEPEPGPEAEIAATILTHPNGAEPGIGPLEAEAPEEPQEPELDEELAAGYDPAACEAFAAGLDDEVLVRAELLFVLLHERSRLDSLELATALSAPVVQLWGLLTNPMKRRADALGLPLPYAVVEGGSAQDPVWTDAGGVAGRMQDALAEEIERRRRAAPAEPGEPASPRSVTGLRIARSSNGQLGDAPPGAPPTEAQVPPEAPESTPPSRRRFRVLATLFGSRGPARASDSEPTPSPGYTPEQCRALASALSDELLERTATALGPLADAGELETVRVAELIGSTPRGLAGRLATPLQRQAGALGLPLPYDSLRAGDGPRVWRDRGGACDRLLDALVVERELRAQRAELAVTAALLERSPQVVASPLAELTRYLLRCHDHDEVVIGLPELRALVNDDLEPDASRFAWWWHNDTHAGGGRARAWLDAGWRAEPELESHRVRFLRAA